MSKKTIQIHADNFSESDEILSETVSDSDEILSGTVSDENESENDEILSETVSDSDEILSETVSDENDSESSEKKVDNMKAKKSKPLCFRTTDFINRYDCNNDYLALNNKIYFDNGNIKTSKKIINDLTRYVYTEMELDYDKMFPLYQDRETEYDFDDVRDERPDLMEIRFENYLETDDEYYYVENYPEIDYTDKCYRYPEFVNHVVTILKKYGPRNVFFEGIDRMSLMNNNGINHDFRGVRELDWKLHYWDRYRLGLGSENISFHDFIIGCYKIRSHKFENNYELYCGVDDITVSIVNRKMKNIILGITFDHGS